MPEELLKLSAHSRGPNGNLLHMALFLTTWDDMTGTRCTTEPQKTRELLRYPNNLS